MSSSMGSASGGGIGLVPNGSVKVTSEEAFWKGLHESQHIAIIRNGIGTHHALISKFERGKNVFVIHRTPENGVEEVDFLEKILQAIKRGALYVVQNENIPMNKEDRSKVIRKARQRLGDKDYDLFRNNCEHLVNESLTDNPTSSQVRAGVGILATFFGFLFTVAVYLGWSSGSSPATKKKKGKKNQLR